MKFYVKCVENEKTAIINVRPGRVYYRYIVDGLEQIDSDKPNELYESILFSIIFIDKLYNYTDVEATGPETKNFIDMSNEDLERLAAEINNENSKSRSSKVV